MNNNYQVGTHLILKKGHPCGTNEWEVVRLGVDIKLKSCYCGWTVLIPRIELNKKIKKVKEELYEGQEKTET